ncbi:hypothetical protein J2S11_003325 [Bacillus horti]|uniref:Uncharacterized protein n=1 Tax=Caldalkalibacillus horti TaxID=77523 RepID=A0ABT9W3H8_9BACI|nr:hypothetical protein [Bacillus horti]
MDEFFRRRSKNKGFYYFMIFVLILGIGMFGAGIWFIMNVNF